MTQAIYECFGQKEFGMEACESASSPSFIIEPQVMACRGCTRAALMMRQKEIDSLRKRLEATERARDFFAALSLRDVKTGIANEYVAKKRFEDLAKEAKELPETGFGMISLDIENFKGFNDARGQVEGDRLIREAALRFEEVKRKDDLEILNFRDGGDEFCFLVPLQPRIDRQNGNQVKQPEQRLEVATNRFVEEFLNLQLVAEYNSDPSLKSADRLGLHTGFAVWDGEMDYDGLRAAANPKAHKLQS